MTDVPSSADYAQVMQNPGMAFLDDDLRTCEIERKGGLPFGASGAYAVVYKATLESGNNLAVRVFTSFNPKITRRYEEISAYLATCKHLSPLVDFNFCEKGIRVPDSKTGRLSKYPLVTMEWVKGETLYSWTQERCVQRKKKDLVDATDKWRKLMEELRGAKIAHGDLQHANIMVTDTGDFKLVDYDCMCVPNLVGEPNLEIGVEPYQHPSRDENTKLSQSLDNFSSIFIFVALRALANDQRLWDRYVEDTKYDKLLFRRDDLERPRESQLFESLMHSSDADLGRMSKDLSELFRAEMDEVPSLEDFLFSYDRVRALLDAGDFDKAVQLLDRHKGSDDGAPPNLLPRFENARQRVECRRLVEQMVDAGNEQGMAQHYDATLLNGYPLAAAAAAVAKDAETVIPIIAELNRTRQANAWRDFVAVWDSNQRLIAGRKSCKNLAQEASDWRQRNNACDAFLKCINRQPEPDVAAMDRSWQSLEAIGGHPEAEQHRSRVINLLARQQAWNLFESTANSAKASAGQEKDQEVVNAWKESYFKAWNTAERRRAEFQQAQQRLEIYRKLEAVVQSAPSPPTTAGEKRIADQASVLPGGYQHDYVDRVQQAGARVSAADGVRRVLVEPASEHRILDAWHKLKPLQGGSLLDQNHRERIELAERRAPLIDRLQQIPSTLPLDQLDTRILSVWQENVLRECHDARQWRPIYEVAKHRKTLLARLGQAVNENNERAIVDAADDACLRDYPLPRGWLKAIDEAKETILGVEVLAQALQAGDRSGFRDNFDARIVRTNQTLFAPYRDRIVDWVQSDVLAAEAIGLAYPTVLEPLSPLGENVYKLRWSFPGLDFPIGVS